MNDAGENYARRIESARRAMSQDPAEAERLLLEAIYVGERQLGADHPSLGVALNELSRLHIRQSDFARAEPVLKRLLNLARAKGDTHPDVATALAGLAVAKRGLGENVAAEVLYRHALRIREEVLAPHHMAIVVTLEQLSETCATRGNLVEALVHLKHALPKREGALGADHATVASLRARIADLERRIMKSSAKPAQLAAARPTTERRITPVRSRTPVSLTAQPTRSSELVFLYQPEPPAPRAARPAFERAPVPTHSVAVASAAAVTVQPFPQTQSTTLARTAPAALVATSTHLPASIADALPALADAPLLGTPSRDVTDLFASVKRATRYASAGAAVVVLAIVGADAGTSDTGESDHGPTVTAPNAAVIAPPPTAPSGTAAVGVSAVETPSRESHAAPAAKTTPSARASDALPSAPSAPLVAMPALRKLVVPKVAMPSLDSLMRSGERGARDDDSAPNNVGAGLLPSATNGEASVRPPVLVYAPTLRFPDELRAKPIDGEVIVQFRVNDKGRVDASTMQVVQSGHELFTNAVRNVLPRFRFEPARASTPGSKPQAAWVQFRAEFTGRN